MTSQPPPPPTLGSTPFVAAIVVMLMTIGGLLLWKTSGRETVPTSVQAASSAPIVTESLALPEVPAPPPPPAEEPVAAVAVHAASAARTIASAAVAAANPCGGECNGKPTPTLRRQLEGLGRTARRCYDQALQRNGDLKGRIMVSVRVGPSGQVCSASVAENATGDAELGACVAQKYRTAQLSGPQGGCIDAEVPLNFVPDHAR